MFNAHPRIDRIAITPTCDAFVIDDALNDPQRMVELAAEHRAAFAESSHNAYPGPELRLPDSLSAQLDGFFAQHVRARLGARRTLRMYSRLALATRGVDALAPRQWICHRDRLDDAPDRLVAACVLYLFRDIALGGTAFFVPTRDPQATAVLIHESGTLSAAAFTQKYGIERDYPHASNAWFEKSAEIAPKWNRLIFYEGGAAFHASAIAHASRLTDDPRNGRLTLNGFFVCRRAIGPGAACL